MPEMNSHLATKACEHRSTYRNTTLDGYPGADNHDHRIVLIDQAAPYGVIEIKACPYRVRFFSVHQRERLQVERVSQHRRQCRHAQW